jgi:hypothetical protein
MAWINFKKKLSLKGLFGKQGAAQVKESVHDVERSVKATLRDILDMLPTMPTPDLNTLYNAVQRQLDKLTLGGK